MSSWEARFCWLNCFVDFKIQWKMHLWQIWLFFSPLFCLSCEVWFTWHFFSPLCSCSEYEVWIGQIFFCQCIVGVLLSIEHYQKVFLQLYRKRCWLEYLSDSMRISSVCEFRQIFFFVIWNLKLVFWWFSASLCRWG